MVPKTIYMINKYILENHLLLWKLNIHNHVFISHAYINHIHKSHVCLTIPYSCSNHDSKYNRTWNPWKYIQVWKDICFIKQKLIDILVQWSKTYRNINSLFIYNLTKTCHIKLCLLTEIGELLCFAIHACRILSHAKRD